MIRRRRQSAPQHWAAQFRADDRDPPVASPETPLQAEAFLSVCTEELKHEIAPWLASVAHWHPASRIYLAGDYPACHEGYRLAVKWGIAQRFFPLPFLAGEGRSLARARCGSVGRVNDYWKEEVIWWKIEALRWVLTFAEPDKGVLLTDCDITFAGPVRESWPAVDLVLSPFWWWSYRQVVERREGIETTLPQRDGFFNAGYLLTRRAEVATAWMELYERGEGGFYEQKCLECLPQRFATDYFTAAHNWGKWRRESPRADTVSLHYHWNDQPHGNPPPQWLVDTKEAATAAGETAIAMMGGR